MVKKDMWDVPTSRENHLGKHKLVSGEDYNAGDTEGVVVIHLGQTSEGSGVTSGRGRGVLSGNPRRPLLKSDPGYHALFASPSSQELDLLISLDPHGSTGKYC